MDTERFNHAIALRESGKVEAAHHELLALSEAASDAEEKASLLANQARCSLLLGRLEEARSAIDLALA